MIKKYVPSLTWIRDYKKEFLRPDIIAGLTVGVMLIPQGMAYALLAGLPPIFGLYAALVPQIIYTFLGTSRQLAVGPVAMDSLLVGAGLGALAISGIQDYISMAIFLSLFMGVIQLFMGVLNMGFLVNFLSKPVISGFTSAAAIIIGFNQLKHLFGIQLKGSNKLHEIIISVYEKIDDINWIALVIGVGGIIVIYLLKKYKPIWPGALIAVVLSILLVYTFQLDGTGLAIVGEVPPGLPSFSVPTINIQRISSLFPLAMTLAVIAYMEAISIAKTLEARHDDYEIDSSQELIALGTSNIFGSFFQAYPTTGGFSRSALYEQLGNKTGIAALVSALVVGITLLFLTRFFYFLPTTILAAIIMVAILNLIDLKYARKLWNTRKTEFYLLAITFLVTLFVGIIEGIIAGVAVSLFMLIYRVSHPHIAELGRIPDQPVYRNVHRFNNLVSSERFLLLRIDAQLYFANLSYIKDYVDKKLASSKNVRYVVIHAGSINFIDTSGIDMLNKLSAELFDKGISLSIVEVRGPVRDLLLANAQNNKSEIKFFLTLEEAVKNLEYPEDHVANDSYTFQSEK